MTGSIQSFTTLLVVLAVVSYACRVAGFWLMRYVPHSRRLEEALGYAPMAVMLGIVAPAALRGGFAERIGLAVVVLLMVLRRGDLVAALAGVCAVGLARWTWSA